MTSCEAAERENGLILRAQQGDMQAMEALLVLHQPLLHALCGRLFCPAQARAELVQAGCVGMMQAVYRFEPGRGVRLMTYAVPWILGEMKRALRALYASAGTLSLEGDSEEERIPLTEKLRGSDGVDIEAVALRVAIQQLPDEQRTLICLRYFRDMTQKETAVLLHKSQAQISRIERHALDRLRALLA